MYDIADWISRLPSSPTENHNRKRCRRDDDDDDDHEEITPSLISPPLSLTLSPPFPSSSTLTSASALPDHMSHDNVSASTPRNKRQRTDVGTVGVSATDAFGESPLGLDEITPRPERFAVLVNEDASERSSMSASTGATASSRASSPRKKMAALGLAPDGIEARPLTLEHPSEDYSVPPSLANMLRQLDPFAAGIISQARKAGIDAEPLAPNIPDFFFGDPAIRDRLGPTPSIDHVLDIVSQATECLATGQSEHGWNCSVHYPLLQMALHGENPRQRLKDGVRFVSCTTAKIIKQYLPGPTSASKMVDFCIYLSPRSPAVRNSIDRLRATRPLQSINHTDFEPLTKGPIAISIETKRPSGSTDMAALQIGTWAAAHWRVLRELMEQAASGVENANELPASQQDHEHGEGDEASDAEGDLPFLPAIIVQGHDWKLAATTNIGRRTILWTGYSLGSTENVLGVYRLVYGLQHLARWSESAYLPWFMRLLDSLNQ